MVFFSCDRCSEALKKNQVDKHGFKCRNTTYSCLDCGQAFSLETYKNHIKCLTENKKYGGKNYSEKEYKGEAKQNRWVEQVERAIENVKERGLKELLEQIRGFDNIPRKEPKFINFLQNSRKIRDRNLCIKAWNCIAEQAKKMQEEDVEAESNKKEGQNSQSNGKPVSCEEGTSQDDARKEETNNMERNGDMKQETRTANGVKKFKWRRAIKRTLREADNGQMKIKRLRNAVVESYLASGQTGENSNEDLETVFDAKLRSLGLHIDGKMVRLE